MEIYCYTKQGDRIGPVTKEGLIELAESGILTANSTIEANGKKYQANSISYLKTIFEKSVGVSDSFAENLFTSSETLRKCAYFIFVSGVITLVVAIFRWLAMDSSNPYAGAVVNSLFNTGIVLIITSQVFFFFSHLGKLFAAQYKQNKEYWERSKNNPR